MARVKRSVNGRKHRRSILEEAKGYTGARSRHFRKANEQVMHSGRYAYRDRRARKGEFRRLWIVRINAACREHDIAYSRFIAGLKAAESTSTARSSPTSRCASRRRSARSSQPRARPSTPPEAPQSRHARRSRGCAICVRDRSARDEAGVFVAEGPRVVAAAFDARGRDRVRVLGADVATTRRAPRRRASRSSTLPAAPRIASATRVRPSPCSRSYGEPRVGIGRVRRCDTRRRRHVLSDPGNVGTLMRSAAAAGATVLGLGAGSVDAYNPKVVRASAGACFAIRTVEGVPAVEMLESLGAHGCSRIGAAGARRARARSSSTCGADRARARPRGARTRRRPAARRARHDADDGGRVAERRDGRHCAAASKRRVSAGAAS